MDPLRCWCTLVIIGCTCVAGFSATCDINLITGPDGVADSDITASSSYNEEACNPYQIRMGNTVGNSWCPASASTSQYVQVGFAETFLLRTLVTQGRGNGQYTKSVRLEISEDGATWTDVKDQNGNVKVLPANADVYSVASHDIAEVVTARYVRVYPQSWNGWPSLRLDFVGCPSQPRSCWRGKAGTPDIVLSVLHETVTDDNGLCGRTCHHFSTCESFMFDFTSHACQLYHIKEFNVSTDSSARLSTVYFLKSDEC